jgi:hypothetical protein
LIEEPKKLIREKSTKLYQSLLNVISSSAKQMISEIEYINEANEEMFSASSTLPIVENII